MAKKNTDENYIELFDVTKKQTVTKASLAEVRFIPRKGERIFISLKGPGDWSTYTVVDVEYFLSHDPSAGEAFAATAGKVTLYVEESK